MDFIFIFGARYLFIFSLIIAVVYFWKQPHDLKKSIALTALIALPLSYLLALAAGALFYNPQPFVVGDFTPLIPHDMDNGFPSHHTLLTAAIAAVIFIFSRGIIGNVLWIIALLVGISRISVGLHHGIDIIGSLVIAIISAFVAWIIIKKFSTTT